MLTTACDTGTQLLAAAYDRPHDPLPAREYHQLVRGGSPRASRKGDEQAG